jgi:hypothetical protein
MKLPVPLKTLQALAESKGYSVEPSNDGLHFLLVKHGGTVHDLHGVRDAKEDSPVHLDFDQAVSFLS